MLAARLLKVALLTLVGAACTYGPAQDYSRINSAALLPDDRVAFSYHRVRFRPATGFAAFPDGGIPKYVEDWHAILIIEPNGATRQIASFSGGGLPGSGSITLMPTGADTRNLLLHRYAQQTTSLPLRYLSEFIRMRPDGSIIERFDLRATLAREGRRLGAKGFGTLQVLTTDGEMLVGAEHGPVTELWLRDPDGSLRLVDRFDDYRGRDGHRILYMKDGAVIIRDLGTGEVLRTDWRDPAARAFEAANEPMRKAVAAMNGATIRISGPGGSEREIRPDLTKLKRDDA